MQFDFTKTEWSRGKMYLPTLPICINGFPIGHVLVDTGACATLLPLELAAVFGIDLDYDHKIVFTGAGGEEFLGTASATKVEYSIEKSGFRPLRWKGTVFFVKDQPMVPLGQYECLSELSVLLDGPKRKIDVNLASK